MHVYCYCYYILACLLGVLAHVQAECTITGYICQIPLVLHLPLPACKHSPRLSSFSAVCRLQAGFLPALDIHIFEVLLLYFTLCRKTKKFFRGGVLFIFSLFKFLQRGEGVSLIFLHLRTEKTKV